ncbi:hypothetical protein DPMN_166708 [Dreissena polymorpha]|uniref:Uncharacterized protein n=1 Tax=Dreissena polymorpha TaxID=45954 RepID=A0A9D4F017_DREPO|nr:hypothetical protein DPMN_166708 [Dreissena polymorpha]
MYIHVTGPYWKLITSGNVPYMELYTHIQSLHKFICAVKDIPEQLLKGSLLWQSDYEIPQERFLNAVKNAIYPTDSLVVNSVHCMAKSMITCIEKQLCYFLPGGQFSDLKISRCLMPVLINVPMKFL